VATLGGGAHIRTVAGGTDLKIGQRNVLAIRTICNDLGIRIIHEDVGEDYGRQMTFDLADGQVDIHSSRFGHDDAKPRPAALPAISQESLIEAIQTLKPISDAAIQTLDLARDPTSSFHQLERLILQDQVLTANLLRLVNSAYYQMPTAVSTVSQALGLLGLNAFRRLVMQIFVHDLFARKLYAYSMEAGALFHHSVVCARITELLINTGSDEEREKAYLAGLLHDLGKVVLERCASARFPQVVDLVLFKGMEFHKAERDVLGTDHPAVGRLVADIWRLPAELGEAIALHHQPLLAAPGQRRLVCAVHVASLLCNMLGVGFSSDTMANQAEPAAFRELGLDGPAVDALLAALPAIVGQHGR